MTSRAKSVLFNIGLGAVMVTFIALIIVCIIFLYETIMIIFSG